MTLSEGETFSVRRFHFTVASLFVLIIMLILIGLLSHRTIPYSKPVWKSSPYGEVQDSGNVKAKH
jgi:hypothetical protein